MLTQGYVLGKPGIEVKGITIHNTGLPSSAQIIYMSCQRGDTDKGCHLLVDENEAIQVLPYDWIAFHTGKGFDWGNKYTIAIEICRSTLDEELYLKAQDRAVSIIKNLMAEFNLTTTDLFFHRDFSQNTYCPHRIFEIYGNKENFIKEVF